MTATTITVSMPPQELLMYSCPLILFKFEYENMLNLEKKLGDDIRIE